MNQVRRIRNRMGAVCGGWIIHIVSAQQQEEDEEFKVILGYTVAWRPVWLHDTLY